MRKKDLHVGLDVYADSGFAARDLVKHPWQDPAAVRRARATVISLDVPPSGGRARVRVRFDNGEERDVTCASITSPWAEVEAILTEDVRQALLCARVASRIGVLVDDLLGVEAVGRPGLRGREVVVQVPFSQIARCVDVLRLPRSLTHLDDLPSPRKVTARDKRESSLRKVDQAIVDHMYDVPVMLHKAGFLLAQYGALVSRWDGVNWVPRTGHHLIPTTMTFGTQDEWAEISREIVRVCFDAAEDVEPKGAMGIEIRAGSRVAEIALPGRAWEQHLEAGSASRDDDIDVAAALDLDT